MFQALLLHPPARNHCIICRALQDCGQEGRACCYSYDTSSEAQRCFPGLSCIATGIISYNSFDKYEALLKNPNRTADRSLMGTCR
jgi:hypothetical protein